MWRKSHTRKIILSECLLTTDSSLRTTYILCKRRQKDALRWESSPSSLSHTFNSYCPRMIASIVPYSTICPFLSAVFAKLQRIASCFLQNASSREVSLLEHVDANVNIHYNKISRSLPLSRFGFYSMAFRLQLLFSSFSISIQTYSCHASSRYEYIMTFAVQMQYNKTLILFAFFHVACRPAPLPRIGLVLLPPAVLSELATQSLFQNS